MRLYEIETPPKLYAPTQLLEKFANFDGDDFNTAQAYDYDDTRRPRLTLRAINKMRKKNDAKKLEIADHKKFVHLMYSNKDELATQQAIEAKNDQLDRATELEKEKIKQKGEYERELLKQKAELAKEKIKQKGEIARDKSNRQADREEEIAKAQYMKDLKERAANIAGSL